MKEETQKQRRLWSVHAHPGAGYPGSGLVGEGYLQDVGDDAYRPHVDLAAVPAARSLQHFRC